jgi:hypothetical protein
VPDKVAVDSFVSQYFSSAHSITPATLHSHDIISGFVADKVAVDSFVSQYFSSAHSITPATLHTHDIILGFDVAVKQTLLSYLLYWGFT